MKRVSRAQLRGQPLDPVCKRAKTTSGEYGAEDKRVFCYGMGDDNGFPLYMCRVCDALVDHATPPKEGYKNG